MTDGQLLAEFARTRAESAFAELVRRHGRMVHGACLRMTGSPELAEEAAQAAFLILARKAASLARKPDAGGWLHRTAGNVARWMKRSELRRRAHEREAAAVRQQQVDPAGQEAFAALAGSLDAELGRLSDGQRQVVVGLYLEGRTRADLTKALGVPEGTVAWRSKAAIEKLRERLSRRDVTLGAAALASALAGTASAAELPASFASLPSLAAAFAAKGAAGAAGAGMAWSLAEGAMKAMFWTKVKVVAAVLVAAALIGGGGGATVVRLTAKAGEPPKDDRGEPPKDDRVGSFISKMKTLPLGGSWEESARQELEKFTDAELHTLVPSLIDLLQDETRLAYKGRGPTDVPLTKLCDRANEALAIIAGKSFGEFPRQGGNQAFSPSPDEVKKRSEELVRAWKEWWTKTQGEKLKVMPKPKPKGQEDLPMPPGQVTEAEKMLSECLTCFTPDVTVPNRLKLLPVPGIEPAAEQKSTIEKLIKELGSDRFEAREDASAKIVKQGRAALDLLCQAAKPDAKGAPGDAEVSQRAQAAIKSIEEIARQNAVEKFKQAPAWKKVLSQHTMEAAATKDRLSMAVQEAERGGKSDEAAKLRAQLREASARSDVLSLLYQLSSR